MCFAAAALMTSAALAISSSVSSIHTAMRILQEGKRLNHKLMIKGVKSKLNGVESKNQRG